MFYLVGDFRYLIEFIGIFFLVEMVNHDFIGSAVSDERKHLAVFRVDYAREQLTVFIEQVALVLKICNVYGIAETGQFIELCTVVVYLYQLVVLALEPPLQLPYPAVYLVNEQVVEEVGRGVDVKPSV